MLPEDGVDRSRYEEDEETTLTILTSSSRGITVTKYDIATLRHEVIVVNYDNNNVQ